MGDGKGGWKERFGGLFFWCSEVEGKEIGRMREERECRVGVYFLRLFFFFFFPMRNLGRVDDELFSPWKGLGLDVVDERSE